MGGRKPARGGTVNTFQVSLLVGRELIKYVVDGRDELDAEANASSLAALCYPRTIIQAMDVLYMGPASDQLLLPGVE